MCAGAIMNARVELVVFGAYDEAAGCCGSLYQLCKDPRFNHQINVKGGIMQDECTNIIKEFFAIKRMKN
ncbi:MAG: deaminase, partial [Acidobacteriota bacterium]|nr:deaminase [Acidobacteriota bacterium]